MAIDPRFGVMKTPAFVLLLGQQMSPKFVILRL